MYFSYFTVPLLLLVSTFVSSGFSAESKWLLENIQEPKCTNCRCMGTGIPIESVKKLMEKPRYTLMGSMLKFSPTYFRLGNGEPIQSDAEFEAMFSKFRYVKFTRKNKTLTRNLKGHYGTLDCKVMKNRRIAKCRIKLEKKDISRSSPGESGADSIESDSRQTWQVAWANAEDLLTVSHFGGKGYSGFNKQKINQGNETTGILEIIKSFGFDPTKMIMVND